MQYIIGIIFIIIAINILIALVNGIIAFVTDTIAPAIGFVIVAFVAIGVAFAIYAFLKDPSKRFIKKNADAIEKKRQKYILKKELKRKLKSEEEQAKAEAITLASRLYEQSKIALGSSKIGKEFEELRIEAEKRIMDAKMGDIDDIIKRYEATISNVEKAENLNSAEKSKLYKDVQSNMNSDKPVNMKNETSKSRDVSTEKILRKNWVEVTEYYEVLKTSGINMVRVNNKYTLPLEDKPIQIGYSSDMDIIVKPNKIIMEKQMATLATLTIESDKYILMNLKTDIKTELFKDIPVRFQNCEIKICIVCDYQRNHEQYSQEGNVPSTNPSQQPFRYGNLRVIK